MSARFFAGLPLATGDSLQLPDRAARHAQVLRLQPGDAVLLFNGQGGAFEATIVRMGRSEVEVRVGSHQPAEREAQRAVQIAIGMPANERMDWLVEKASELGAAGITPLMTERAVLRLKGERADKKLAHWQGVAMAACEQCGRNRLPLIDDVASFTDWLARLPAASASAPRLLLSLRPGSQPLTHALAALGGAPALTLLSGPEGGLSPAEENAALARGFAPVSLGPRTLRAETAALAALALIALEA